MKDRKSEAMTELPLPLDGKQDMDTVTLADSDNRKITKVTIKEPKK